MPRYSSGRKITCRTWGLGFNSRVRQSAAGLFSVFLKIRSLELFGTAHLLLHGPYTRNGEM